MNTCPAREQLERLLTRQLTNAEQDALEGHVEACTACQHLLESLTATPDLPDSALAPTPLAATEHEVLVQKLRQSLSDSDRARDNLNPTLDTRPVAKHPSVTPRFPEIPGYEILDVLGQGGMG